MQLAVFSMGGTIDKVYFDDLSDYTVGDPQVGTILAAANVDIEFEVMEVARKDSLYVTDDERRAAIYEAIGLINEQLWIGHFELWSSSGIVP